MSETTAAADAAPKPLTRRDLEAMIAKRAVQNEEFRAEFIADPAACFTKYLGIPPQNLPKFVVHEEAPGSWHIVLPPKPDPMRELSDEELEQVSGGLAVEALIVGTIVFGGLLGGMAAVVSGLGASVATASATAGAYVGTKDNHNW